jgi:hypothetical protein
MLRQRHSFLVIGGAEMDMEARRMRSNSLTYSEGAYEVGSSGVGERPCPQSWAL